MKNLPYKNWITKQHIELWALITITLLVSIPYIILITKTHTAPGMDGEMLLALIESYLKSTYPRPFGYIFNINVGHVWPLFYGPFFTYLTAFISAITNLEPLTIVKTILILILITQPLLIYALSKTTYNDRSIALVTSIIFVGQSYSLVPSACYGPGVCGGLRLGMYGQFVGQYLTYIYLLIEMGGFKKPPWTAVKILIISSILSSSFYSAKLLLIIFVVMLSKKILSKQKLAALRLSLEYLAAAGLISFYTIPAILYINYQYGLTQTLISVQPKLPAIYSILFNTDGILLLIFFIAALFSTKPKFVVKNQNTDIWPYIFWIGVILSGLYTLGFRIFLDNRTVNAILPLTYMYGGLAVSHMITKHNQYRNSITLIAFAFLFFTYQTINYLSEKGSFFRFITMNRLDFSQKAQIIAKNTNKQGRLYFVPFRNPSLYLEHQKYIGYLSRQYNINTLWCSFQGTNMRYMDEILMKTYERAALNGRELREILSKISVTDVVTDVKLTQNDGFLKTADLGHFYMYKILDPKPIVKYEEDNENKKHLNINIKPSSITIDNIETQDDKPTRLIIRITFFPFLRDAYGGSLEQTQDGLTILTTKNKTAEIRFTTTAPFKVGGLISVISAVLVMLHLAKALFSKFPTQSKTPNIPRSRFIKSQGCGN